MKRMLGRIVGVFVGMMLVVSAFSQSISFQQSKFIQGPYGQGSSVSCPIKISGCFDTTNKFELYLSVDSFKTESKIGSFDGFYTTFVNGNIPITTTPSNQYQIRVKSTNPSLTSNASNIFEIKSNTTPVFDSVNTDTRYTLIGGIYFGSCSKPKEGFQLELNNFSSSGSIINAELTDELTSSVVNPIINNNKFTLTLNRHYYRFMVSAQANGILSTRSYFIINSPNNLGFTTSGQQTGCIPNSLSFSIPFDTANNGIANNFPGTRYLINWGDGSAIDKYKHCDLVASKGVISHSYTITSCTKTSGADTVTAYLQNPFFKFPGTSTQQGCENPQVGSTALIFKNPDAKFRIDSNLCEGKPIKFIQDTANAGIGTDGGSCTQKAYYKWTLDGNIVYNSNSPEFPPPSYTASNLSLGSHTMELMVDNQACDVARLSKTFCVLPKLVVGFKINGQDSLNNCAPLKVTITNNTNTASCGGNKYEWIIFDSTRIIKAPKNTYTYISGDSSSPNPVIQFNIQGLYYIQLNAYNNCTIGIQKIFKAVNVIGTTNVSLPAAKSYCGTKTINFGSDPNHKPSYNSSGAGETYLWSVTGGAFSFVNGTTSASAFPQISFTDFATYTVSLVFTNNCGTKTISQQITFTPAPSVNAGNDTTVCFIDSSVPVYSSVTGGSFNSGAWSVNPSTVAGVFTNATAANTVYTFSNTNKSNLSVTLVYTVTTSYPACPTISDEKVVTILPENKLTSSKSESICSGATFNYQPTSTLSTSSFKWTSSVVAGNASGNKSSGTGNIADVLINSSSTNIAKVKYIITPVNGACDGTSDSLIVTINPTPQISNADTTTPKSCGASNGEIILKGLGNGLSYSVTYTFSGSPFTKTFTANSSGEIVITNLTKGTYTNIFVTLNGCQSAALTQVVLSDPGFPSIPTIAQNNVRLCSGALLQLTVASPNAAFTYSWSKGGFLKDSTQLSINPVSVKDSGTYSVVSNQNGCASAATTVHVAVDSTPAKPTITPVIALCLGNNLHLQAQSVSDPIGTIRYQWYGPIGFTSFTKDTTIINANSNNGGTYKVWATNGTCVSDTTSITVAVRASLTQAAINGTKDNRICNFAPPTNATQSLSGYLDISRPYEKGKWTIIKSSTNSNPIIANDTLVNTTISFDKSGIYWIQWAISNDAGCSPTTDTIRFNVVDKPAITQSLSTKSFNVCASNPVTITVDTNAVYGQIKYWQIKRPYNATNWKDTLIQSPSITFNNVQDSFIVRLVVISKDTMHCGYDSATKDVQINVAPPSNAGSAKGDTIVCSGNNGGTITLSGNTGTASWQSSTDSILFTNISASIGQQFAFSNLIQTTWFRSVVKSGTCDSVFSNAIKITVVPAVTIANAGSDKSLCADSIYHLQANTPTSVETGTWKFATSDTGKLDNIHDPNTFIRGLKANTTYYLIWSIDNHICASTKDTIVITNLNPLTNTIDTSTETKCNSASITVIGNSALGGSGIYTYQWEVKRGNTWYSIPGATTESYSFVADTSVVLHRLVLAGPCTSTSLEKTIYVQPPLGNNFISGNNNACINTPVGLLTGSTPTGADNNFQYQWQETTDTINVPWTDIVPAINKDFNAPILTQTTFYRRKVSSNLCAGNQSNTSAIFTVTVRPDASAAWQIIKDTSCTPFNIDNAALFPLLDTSKNNSYSWYAHDSLYGNSINSNPGFVLVGAGDSVSIKMVAISRYGCKNDSLSHWFFTPPRPDTRFKLSDSSGCGPLAVTITNTTPLQGGFRYQYFWDFGFGQTSTLANPGVVVFPSSPSNKDTIYVVKLTAFTACDTVTVSKNIKVRSKAKAIFTPSKTFGCSPLTDTFINTSRGDSTTYLWQFGDNTSLSVLDSLPVSHTYNTGAQDTFNVKLIAKNYCGNDTAQYAIVVAKSTIDLRIIVNGNELTNCRNSVVHFINTTKGASTFNWDFGDGNQATTFNNVGGLDTIIHRYDTTGTFKVSIRATNNCTDTTGGLIIKVLSTPTAAFVATPDTVCIGHPIGFKNYSNATTSLVWAFGDGTGSLLTNPNHAYKTAGNFNVQLIAARQHPSANICRDTAIRQVTIIPSLPGSMKVSDSISVCVPFTVSFTNIFAASTKLCSWSFGDGSTGTGNTITHTFTAVGTYQVVMNAMDTGGCTYTATKQIVVNGPAGFFVYDHGIVCGKIPVRLEATVTGTDSLKWDFGNGETRITNDRIVYYTYPQSGKFVPNVTLLSGIRGSCKVLLKGIDTITIDHVKAGFATTDLKVCDLTTVNFIDTSRAFLGLKTWAWQFGDGTTSALQNPKHRYLTTNTWAVQLIVQSKSGCSDTADLPTLIKVNNTPQASILANNTGCATQAVVYDAIVTSIDPATYFSWTFSNGTSGNTPTINAYYALAGTYTAKLIVGTAFGCYDTAAIASIKINPTPIVTTNPDFKICKGQSAFINTIGAPTYQWTPSTGLSCNTCPNPIANPITTTQYVVAGYNSFGCAGRDTMLVTVIQPFQLVTSGNDTMCIGDNAHQLTVSGAFNYRWFPPTGLSAVNIPTPLANPTITTKYRVIGTDNFSCFADTAYLVVAVGTYPKLRLGGDLVLATGTQLPLNPILTYSTSTGGPIGNYAWSPTADLSCENCPNPIATIKHDVCYSLVATNIYGCSSNADTMCIRSFCENSQLFVPNAFTPDNDGVNDKLVVRGKGIRVIKSFRIFNRWGQVVFEKANFQPNEDTYGWDGTIKGVPATADVYVYTCEVVCENDVPFVFKGNIAILK